ncbi:hypothetical protein ACWCQ1_48945 [Streptomyces sp. NPDC002144]
MEATMPGDSEFPVINERQREFRFNAIDALPGLSDEQREEIKLRWMENVFMPRLVVDRLHARAESFSILVASGLSLAALLVGTWAFSWSGKMNHLSRDREMALVCAISFGLSFSRAGYLLVNLKRERRDILPLFASAALALAGVFGGALLGVAVLRNDRLLGFDLSWSDYVIFAGIPAGMVSGNAGAAYAWSRIYRPVEASLRNSTALLLDELLFVAAIMRGTSKLRDFSAEGSAVGRHLLLGIRNAFLWAAWRIEKDHLPATGVHWWERRLRAAAREPQLRVGLVLRRHADAAFRVLGPRDIERMYESLSAGCVAAAACDWDALLEHAPPITPKTRLRRGLRRVAPSCTVALFGLVIPLLPGVGAIGGNLRVLLLATAVLMLMPGADKAQESVRDALGKAWPVSTLK